MSVQMQGGNRKLPKEKRKKKPNNTKKAVLDWQCTKTQIVVFLKRVVSR
jgi:hypothetical protein